MGKGKKKGDGNKASSQQDPKSSGDGEDWEALLDLETAAVNGPTATTTGGDNNSNNLSEKSSNDNKNGGVSSADGGVDAAAAAFLATQGIGDDEEGGGGGGGGGGKKKKKKKKKKGGGGGGGEGLEKAQDSKQSARGKIVAERIRLQREEEERRRKEEEEEASRIAEIERKEEEGRKRIKEEKERIKQKKKEKIERQKREGTYMTPKERERKRQTEQRLEAMRAAGLIPTTGPNVGEEKTNQRPKKVVYDNRKRRGAKGKQQQQNQQQHEDKEDPTTQKENKQAQAGDTTKHEDEEQEEAWEEDTNNNYDTNNNNNMKDDNKDKEDDEKKDDGDGDSSSGDDWDADSDSDDDKFSDLTDRLKKVGDNNDDVEDLELLEKQKEQERLRQIGLERAERERIEAEKRAVLLKEQEEANLREQLIAQKREEGRQKRIQQEKANLEARTRDDLRCPIVVIMGHVDTGKTKLLDKIRKTNVQEGEAGGITQQIGATFFEKKTLELQTARLNETEKVEFTVPGMLVIDTPGHESFTNLRSRGSSLCDIAILVVDLMHGLEQQTIESLTMLRKRGVPFVVALNKVDRCYAWKTCKDTPIREALDAQEEGTKSEFQSRALDAKIQLQEQGVNSNLYWEMGNEDWTNSDFIPLVPTSAISGEGVQDVLLLLCQIAQRNLWKQLMWCASLQCTVLEVKAIDGLGMTVDVLMVNGYLREGDKAVFCTLDGPIVTEIRGLLTPPPSREMRIKSEYIHHKEIKGALGVKIIGNHLEKVMAGTPVMIVGPDDEEEDIKAEVMSDLTKLEEKLSTDKKGVLVQASTLGALEALLQFLREETKPPIPVSAIGIGTIHKRDVTKISIMNEKGHPEYATILAFDVEIEREAREYAAEMNVRIMTADIIYHLFDQFTRFMDEITQKRREEASAVAVFPSIIKILPQHVFNQKDPIIVGVEVVEGILKVGTPLCVPAIGGLHVGNVTSIEQNGKEQNTAKKGSSVAIKIVNESNPNITYGRQFDAANMLYSTLTRASIDALKENFKDQLEMEEWKLVVKLKKVYNII